MDHKEFRKIGTQMIDWITEYKDNPNKWDVTSKEEPGYLAKVLPSKILRYVFRSFVKLPSLSFFRKCASRP